MMKKHIRQNIIQSLWDSYQKQSEDMASIQTAFTQRGIGPVILDHFAVIDLPGPYSGIPVLKALFADLGYEERGKDYLVDKQNDFAWMAEVDCMDSAAATVLPQVVVADFRLHEMPIEIRAIIEKYAAQATPLPHAEIKTLFALATAGDANAAAQYRSILLRYLSGRDWPLPSVKEFRTVQAFNELLAWVLVFGRRPNHFTLSVHLLHGFASLNDFLSFIENEVHLKLNREGGITKGGKSVGIAQSSTTGILKSVPLADGRVEIPMGFVEFVWRYPKQPLHTKSGLWRDYFTGFIGAQANHVIESLYSSVEQP